MILSSYKNRLFGILGKYEIEAIFIRTCFTQFRGRYYEFDRQHHLDHRRNFRAGFRVCRTISSPGKSSDCLWQKGFTKKEKPFLMS